MKFKFYTLTNYFILISLIIITTLDSSSYSQTPSKLHLKDTLLLKPLLDKGNKLLNSHIDSAEWYMLEAEKIINKLKYERGYLEFASSYIRVLNQKGNFSEGLKISQKALDIAEDLNDKSNMASAYNNIAHAFTNLGNYDLMLKNQYQALKIAEDLNDSIKIRKFTSNLASVLIEIGDKEKSYLYAKKGYDIAVKLKDSIAIASSLVSLANSEIINSRYESATAHYNQLLLLAQKIDDPSYQLDAIINLGHVYSKTKRFNKALESYQKGVPIIEHYQAPDYVMYVHWGIAESQFNLGQLYEADHYLQQSIEVANSIGAIKELRYMYLLASEIKEKRQQLASALAYRKKYEQLNDSVLGEETRKNIQKLEVEYQISQKEKEIAQQQLQITKSNLEIETKDKWIVTTVSAIVLLILISLFIYVIYKNKQKSVAKQLTLLEKEKEIQVLEAMINGEEKERSRMAKELHDGIGGILSASKMHLSIYFHQNESEQLRKTLGLIDTASTEVRNIAHNLAPEILVQYGFDKALEAFCERMSSQVIDVQYYNYAEIPHLKMNFQISVYRIIQELLNNAIKHSEASQAIVQVNFHEHKMTVTVEDNGVGFSESENVGIGLKNLQSRINVLGGSMEISSEKNGGTSVYLEFDIQQHVIADHSVIVDN